MPEVRGIIQSLVGCEPLYDHHAVHTVEGGKEKAQHWHADAIIDTRMHFDVQLFYYPHDTPREMGGTMFLPGSQFRRINESDIRTPATPRSTDRPRRECFSSIPKTRVCTATR